MYMYVKSCTLYLSQVQINVSLSPTHIHATILLNRLRLMGLFDLILALKSFVFEKLPEDTEGEGGREKRNKI